MTDPKQCDLLDQLSSDMNPETREYADEAKREFCDMPKEDIAHDAV